MKHKMIEKIISVAILVLVAFGIPFSSLPVSFEEQVRGAASAAEIAANLMSSSASSDKTKQKTNPLSTAGTSEGSANPATASAITANLLNGAIDLDALLDALPPKNLYLSEVKKLAITKDRTYKKIKLKIITKKAKYTDAVKRINAKKIKLSTFSWTPLLNFKFPTDPSFTEEFDFYLKPITIQAEITTLTHQLRDQLYAIYEKATNLYVQIYTLQEKIKFNKNVLETRKKTLEKNEARLILGLAQESDVKAIRKSVTKVEKQILKDERSFENKKDKLKKMTGVDVRSRYTYVNPYMEAVVERTELDTITQYTLDNSQKLFEANSNTNLAVYTLNQYYKQMLAKYGSDKMSLVSQYVTDALNGVEVDGEILKEKFDALIKKVDEKWDGKLKILFIKIPKLWFKGATAGSRYIEDEPYALYNAILDLQEARNEQASVVAEIKDEVKDAYENLKALETTYHDDEENLKTQSRELEEALIKNQLGYLTFEEYTQLQEKYEEDQLTAAADLDSYTQSLSSFDRLTCGAITALLTGAGINAEDTVGGDSYLVAEITEGMTYYIKVMQEANVFILGLNVPDDFEIDVTKYELWVDEVMVASADIHSTIEHFCFELDGSERVFLRFYKGEDDKTEKLCDVTIDPSQYSGKIDLITGYKVVKVEDTIIDLGDYSLTKNADGTVTFTFTANSELEGAESYKLTTLKGVTLGSGTAKVGQPLRYLSLLEGSMNILDLVVLDKDGKEIARGTPDPETMKVKGERSSGESETTPAPTPTPTPAPTPTNTPDNNKTGGDEQ